MEAGLGKVVLYDGVCNLCDSAVRFILPRDSKGKISFASLQGEFARGMLTRYGIKTDTIPESLILIEDGKVFQDSTGVLRIARSLDFPWSLAALFLLVPRPIRDFVYRRIARNRYRWFGREESCLIPKAEWRARFLEWPVDEKAGSR